MKISLAFSFPAACLLGATTLLAQNSFTDDFNRADTLFDIGPGWTEVRGNWEIRDNRLRPDDADSTNEKIAAYTAIQTDEAFMVEADLDWVVAARNQWNGIAWNIQDGLNYYVLRTRIDSGSIQAIRMVNGSPTTAPGRVIANLPSGTISIPQGAVLTMRVQGDGNGNFWWSILREGEVQANGTFTDTHFSGGNAGIYGAHDRFSVDRFHIRSFSLTAEAPELRISQAVEVHFETSPGIFYQVQSSPDLVAWTPETDFFMGDGNEYRRLFSIRDQNRRFFRVLASTD